MAVTMCVLLSLLLTMQVFTTVITGLHTFVSTTLFMLTDV
jgi:hypothetical protein